MPTSSHKIRIIRALTIRYVLVLVSLALLTGLSYLTLDSLIATNQDSAARINVSGRQRMLSQRINLFSEQLVTAPSHLKNDLRRKLEQAISTMQRSHAALLAGDANLGIRADLSEDIKNRYFGPTSYLSRTVHQYLEDAHELLSVPDASLDPDHPALVRIRQAREALLRDLDGVVQRHQEESDQVIAKLRIRALLFAFFTLIVLVVSGVFVFRPLTHQVRQKMVSIEKARGLLRAVHDSALDAIMTTDDEGRIIETNKAAPLIFGFASGELHGKKVVDLVKPNSSGFHLLEDFSNLVADAQSSALGRWIEVEGQRADGSCFPAEFSITGVQNGGRPLFTAFARDISDRRQAEEIERLATVVFDAVSQAIIVTGADGRIVAVNPMFTTITGFEADEAIGKTPALLKSGRHDKEFYSGMWKELIRNGRWTGEIWNRRKNGQEYPEWLSISTVANRSGSVERYVGVFSDITERKRSEEIIWHQANFDELTDLPKRGLLQDRLNHDLIVARREKTKVALLFIDLDRFKPVNDTLGHQAGDLLLKQVAERLMDSMRESDTVARVGGDEFAAALPLISGRADVEPVVQKILARLAEPFMINGEEITISACIGIAIFPDDGDDGDALLGKADRAMYRAKTQGHHSFAFASLGIETTGTGSS